MEIGEISVDVLACGQDGLQGRNSLVTLMRPRPELNVKQSAFKQSALRVWDTLPLTLITLQLPSSAHESEALLQPDMPYKFALLHAICTEGAQRTDHQ